MRYSVCTPISRCRAAKCSSPSARLEHGGADRQALQALLGLRAARRLAADADHLVQRRDGDELAFEDVAAPLGLAQQVLGAPADHLDAMPQELLDHLLDRQVARPAVHQGQQDDAHRLLQRRQSVELIEDELRVGVALQVDDEPHRLAGALAALVLDVVDALDALVLDQLADGLGQADARLLVGHLLDDDLRPVAFLVDLGAGAERDLAAAGGVGVEDALPAADDAAGREVGPGQHLHEFERSLASGSSISRIGGVADFAEVVRRNVGGHADGDAVGAVDQQVGEPAGQDDRLQVPAVVVGDDVDGFVVRGPSSISAATADKRASV